MATLGFLFLALGARQSRWLVPGPVSRSHGDLQECESCHSAFDGGPAEWLSAAVQGIDTELESGKCLVCHRMGEDALRPHSQPPVVLARISRQFPLAAVGGEATVLGAVGEFFHQASEPLETVPCGRCHGEHRGREADLTVVADSRCQTCHRLRFPSFADRHPPFESYPSDRPTNVVFDHARHFHRHFPQSGRTPPSSCGSCHLPDLFGRKMIVRSFDETCSDCHLGQISGTDRTAGLRAIAVLVVPGIDVDTLRERGHNVGQWPAFSEEELTPFIELLLSGDPSLRRALRRVRSLDDPLDLRDADDDDLAAVTRVAWAVKELIYDLLMGGAEEFAVRLEAITGQRVGRTVLTELVGAMPRDAVGSAQQEWFPDLLTEVPAYRSGRLTAESSQATPDSGANDSAAAPPVDSELDLLADQAGPDPEKDNDELLVEDDDLLADAGDDLLAGGDDLLGDLEGWETEEEIFDLATPAAKAEPLVELPTVDPELWASLGGWYRRDFALYYRPVGHGDRLIRTWLDLLGLSYGSFSERIAAPLFESLSDPMAPGACGKCHRVARSADDRPVVNWSAGGGTQVRTGFTIFSHVPHFSLAGGGRCEACHTLNRAADGPSPNVADEPSRHPSSFRDIAKDLCAECHVTGAAGEACTQCHGYHVGVARHAAPSTQPLSTSVEQEAPPTSPHATAENRRSGAVTRSRRTTAVGSRQ